MLQLRKVNTSMAVRLRFSGLSIREVIKKTAVTKSVTKIRLDYQINSGTSTISLNTFRTMPKNHETPHNLEAMVPPWVFLFKKTLFEAVSAAPEAMKSKAVPSYPFTLSTVSVQAYTAEDGTPRTRIRPHARTCMFRGFAGESGVLIVTTDKRMAKFDQLSACDGVFEACFYFEKQLAQYRLTGVAKLVCEKDGEIVVVDAASGTETPAGEEVLRIYNSAWDGLSVGMQLSFSKPAPGGEITNSSVALMDKVSEATESAKTGKAAPPELLASGKSNFVVVLLAPEIVDYVNVEGVGQRVQFTLANEYEWEFHEINP